MSTNRHLGSVVVATDFSEGARRALDRAALLPLGKGASIDVIHVAEEGERNPGPRLEGLRRSLVNALEAAGSEEHEVFVSTEEGKAPDEIARLAHHGLAELIVLGRHGERKLRDRVLGTTVERVIRTSDVSVLVVSKPPAEPYRRLLVAVDLSASSRLALELALELRGEAAGTIDVLHVVESLTPAHTADMFVPDPVELRAELEQQARADLAELLAGIEGGAASWNPLVLSGDPRTLIVEQARRRQTELLLLGTKGRTGLAHVLLGSVAEGVVRDAPCDVLVARLPRADAKLAKGPGHARRRSGPVVL